MIFLIDPNCGTMTAADLPEGSDGTGGGGTVVVVVLLLLLLECTAAATCALCAVTGSAALSHGISSAGGAGTGTEPAGRMGGAWNAGIAGGAGTGTEPAGKMGGGVTGSPSDAPEGMRGSSTPCDTARAVAPIPCGNIGYLGALDVPGPPAIALCSSLVISGI
jgi:hypothetical protein